MTPLDSQVNMYPHSEKKVELLKLYLDRFLNILTQSQFITEVFLFDLFSGPGIHENGGHGSPLVSINSMNESQRHPNGSKLNFQFNFNDHVESKIQQLKHNVSTLKPTIEGNHSINFSSLDYRQALTNCIEKCKSLKRHQRAFIFIDPYGYKDIRVSDLKSLLSSRKTEVLLFLPTHHMFRFESKATPESLKSFIDELIPNKEWPRSHSGLDFIERLKTAFKSNVDKDQFVDSFVIQRDINQFYCLFFFTSHIYGFDRMLDAKWTIDEEQGRGWKYEDPNSLFSALDKRPDIRKFAKSLEQFIRDEQPSNDKIYEFTLRFGYLPKHANEVLSALIKKGLKVTELTGKTARKRAFYLGYKNWKENKNKVVFKI